MQFLSHFRDKSTFEIHFRDKSTFEIHFNHRFENECRQIYVSLYMLNAAIHNRQPVIYSIISNQMTEKFCLIF